MGTLHLVPSFLTNKQLVALMYVCLCVLMPPCKHFLILQENCVCKERELTTSFQTKQQFKLGNVLIMQ